MKTQTDQMLERVQGELDMQKTHPRKINGESHWVLVDTNDLEDLLKLAREAHFKQARHEGLKAALNVQYGRTGAMAHLRG